MTLNIVSNEYKTFNEETGTTQEENLEALVRRGSTQIIHYYAWNGSISLQ